MRVFARALRANVGLKTADNRPESFAELARAVHEEQVQIVDHRVHLRRPDVTLGRRLGARTHRDEPPRQLHGLIEREREPTA